MKIAIISPSNLLYMPYVQNYENVLIENGVEYDLFNWDRFMMEDIDSEFRYRDSKIGHKRSYFDYIKYKRFLIERLKSNKYDKVIVLGIQLSYFLKSILRKKFENKFIIDIRDYNKMKNFFNLEDLVGKSSFTVISSHGYKEWLPDSTKYIVNHNTLINKMESLEKVNEIKGEAISISYIGALRDLSINVKMVQAMKNSMKFNLYFHGEGTINKEFKQYLISKDITNVFLTGKYSKTQERSLYLDSDFINILIPNTDLNSKTLIPNRFYNAAIYGKPIITFEGTYTADLVRKHKLGLVISNFDDIVNNIKNYINDFIPKDYEENRNLLINNVIEENNKFNLKLKEFIGVENLND